MVDARYTVSNNRIEPADIDAPEQRSASETLCYCAYSLVWWSRRFPGESSRKADAEAVATFLIEKNLWHSWTLLARLSEHVLKKVDIEAEFWWKSSTQIDAIAEVIFAFASRNPRGSKGELKVLVHHALFGRQAAKL
jgi:hypothetical protein